MAKRTTRMRRGLQTTPAGFFEGLVIDGRYRLVEEIGRGSIGRVYRAEQLRVNRDVAVKILRRNFLVDERVTIRFEREAMAVAKLDHPNCLTLFDFGYDDQIGSFYMATELLSGQTLREHLDDLTAHSRHQVALLIAEALKHAHASGVVHRDLKPENVIVDLDEDGKARVKVVDFGLAKLFERGDTSGEQRRLTMSGEIYGSPRYLSPEQCRGALDVMPACDMYSFGVLLYEMFEGRVPFDGLSVPAVLTAHTGEPPPPMTSFDTPIDIQLLIEELLSKDPDERPTAHEARDVLARHVNMSFSGLFDEPGVGLNEATLGSDAFDDGETVDESIDTVDESIDTDDERPEPAPEARRSSPFPFPPPQTEEVDFGPGIWSTLGTREARVGIAIGAVSTLLAVLVLAAAWMMLG